MVERDDEGFQSLKTEWPVETRNWESWEELSLEDKVKESQEEDQITKSFITLVKLQNKPLLHEVQSRGDYAMALLKIFNDLVVQNDKLYTRTSDEHGDIFLALVVPPVYSYLVVRETHVNDMHVNTWRLIYRISYNFYIHDIKAVAKAVQSDCTNCMLAAAPIKSKPRKIKSLNSVIGHTCSTDILYLPNNGNFNYVITVIDLATAYVMARPLENKDGHTVASSFRALLLQNNVLFKRVISDEGKEYESRSFKAVIRELGAIHLPINQAAKNIVGAIESANMRILSLLRRTLSDNGNQDWTSILDKVVFALNSSSFLYAKSGTICAPAYLQNARHPHTPSASIVDESMIKRENWVKNLMRKISKERNIEMPDIQEQVLLRRRKYKPGEEILVHNEWIINKHKNRGALYAKLRFFWSRATVIQVLPLDMYLVKNQGEETPRKIHRRLTKPLPTNM